MTAKLLLFQYLGVSNGPCGHLRASEHCVYFANTCWDHIYLASREHFRKYNLQATLNTLQIFH